MFVHQRLSCCCKSSSFKKVYDTNQCLQKRGSALQVGFARRGLPAAAAYFPPLLMLLTVLLMNDDPYHPSAATIGASSCQLGDHFTISPKHRALPNHLKAAELLTP